MSAFTDGFQIGYSAGYSEGIAEAKAQLAFAADGMRDRPRPGDPEGALHRELERQVDAAYVQSDGCSR